MIEIIIKGFILGLAYLSPIGMQNLYVINSALSEKRSTMYFVVFTTAFFDISLSIACFYSIGLILDKIPLMKMAILLFGSIVILYVGIMLIKSNPKLDSTIKVEKNFFKILISSFVVTWANPQAILDLTLLFGSFKITLPPNLANYFIVGVCIASFCWFFSIASIVHAFKNVLNEKFLKIINIVCGSILIYYGFKLLYEFCKILFNF